MSTHVGDVFTCVFMMCKRSARFINATLLLLKQEERNLFTVKHGLPGCRGTAGFPKVNNGRRSITALPCSRQAPLHPAHPALRMGCQEVVMQWRQNLNIPGSLNISSIISQ